MTKKRFLIAIAIVMVLILSVAVFVACNENQTKSYTVKFVDGESEVKSVSVEEGKTIADADVPADLTKDGYVFEGWYVGDVAFDKSAAITADVTYSAKWTKLHTVKFVDGDETIKTATVKDGEKLTDADIPADLTASGKAFEGWFDGTTAFDKDATITADKTFAAKWVGLFNVTFKNGEETIKVAQVKDGAVIAAADIPEDPTDDNYAFIGWFVGETAYDSSAAVTSDIVVNAKFGNINKTLIGTWKGGTLDRSSYTYIHYVLVIGADSIKADLGDGTLVDASNIVWNEDYQTYDFNLAGDTLYSFGEYHGAYSFASADYSVYTNLSKLETGVVSADETALVGTFETKSGVTIGINSTFVTINGVDATEFEYSERDAKYTFYIDDASASIEYDSTEGQWLYVVGGEKDQLVIASMAPAAIPEAYFGVWSNATIGDYSVTTITINADGVFDGGYKIGKVASADATSMTVKSPYGDYIFTLGDGTLTMNNGYSDIVLDKNVKVVFIAGEGYQAAIFYVAKVGADGKIDMDSFALEDPTMAAGYTFKGWFGQDDSTIEFDEDATFTQNTIFVSKIEKTGYVLTFKKSASDSEPVVVVVDKATGKLAASQIPADLTYEDGSVFTGWYTTAGVKAVADLTITQDTTFIAKSVKESDYEGYWLSTASGKEAMLGIDTDAKKLSFLTYTNISYKFENGHIIAQKTGKGYYTIDLFITSNGDIECAYTYFDTIYEEESIEEYVLSKAKAISGVSAGTYRLNKTDYFVINEQGIITTAENGQTTQFGYISGTKTNFTIKYKIGSNSIKTIEGAMVLVGNILCGNYKNDPKMYVYGSESVKDFNCSDDGAHIYEHVVGDKKVYIYTVGGKYSKATITGEVGNGNKITVAYKFYNGESPAVDGSKEYMFVSDTSMVDAGEELGTYTAEGKDSITLDGFGSATIGEKQYSYIINKHNIVVLKSDSETIGVTLDSEAKTYAEATGDGFAHAYIDESDSRYTLTFDGFGGVEYKYVGTYGSPQIAYGSYTLGAGSVTVKGADYFYDKTYSVEESGNVIVSTDGKKVLKVAGYVVESKIKSLEGYYVNGDSTIEIVVAEDKTFKLYVDGALVDAKTNWNGSAITYSALDADAAIDSAKKQKATFTITKDGDNIKVSHDCAVGLDMDGYIEKAVKEATYTASTKPSTGDEDLDAFEGTWKTADGKFTFTFDGKGTVTNEEGRSYAYTVKDGKASFSDGTNDIVCTISGNSLTAAYDDGEFQFTKTFTKEAAATLDAFAGTWVGKPFASEVTLVCDGKGSGTFAGNAIAYTVKGDTIEFECGGCACVVTKSGDKLSFTCDDSEYIPDFDLTKRA